MIRRHEKGTRYPGGRSRIETFDHGRVFDHRAIEETGADILDEVDDGRGGHPEMMVGAQAAKGDSARGRDRRVEVARQPASQDIVVPPKSTGLADKPFGVINQDTRPRQQIPARTGQFGALSAPTDEFHPEFLLQATQALRHGRLGHLQASGSVPEMTLLGDGDKEPQMPDKIHVTTVTR